MNDKIEAMGWVCVNFKRLLALRLQLCADAECVFVNGLYKLFCLLWRVQLGIEGIKRQEQNRKRKEATA